jgi:hypothetical protein
MGEALRSGSRDAASRFQVRDRIRGDLGPLSEIGD